MRRTNVGLSDPKETGNLTPFSFFRKKKEETEEKRQPINTEVWCLVRGTYVGGLTFFKLKRFVI